MSVAKQLVTISNDSRRRLEMQWPGRTTVEIGERGVYAAKYAAFGDIGLLWEEPVFSYVGKRVLAAV